VSASATTYRITLAYRGGALHGVAPQPGLRTVSSVLTDALMAATQERPVALVFAARTDAGVDATMNLCSFRLERAWLAPHLHTCLRQVLPADVHVRAVQVVPRSYHARNSALSKHYRYRLLLGSPPSPRAWSIRVPLDPGAMRALAAGLMGTHDFTALRHPRCSAPNPVRTLEAITLRQRGNLMVMDVQGDGFLRQQVRILAGTLASTGAGWLHPDTVLEAVSRRDRNGTGPTAPAHGLVLRYVYDIINQP